jgi:hypothetical protein
LGAKIEPGKKKSICWVLAQPRKARYFVRVGYWRERWNSVKPAADALIEDAMLFAIFALVLTFVYLVFGIMAWAGYNPQRIDRLETIHYFAYLSVFGLFMLDLVLRVMLHTFRKR